MVNSHQKNDRIEVIINDAKNTMEVVLMNPVENILREFPMIILDCAFSTELERRGCDIKDELWSAKTLIEQPELIGQVHVDYFAAGADVAITASYQATVQGFMSKGISEAEALRLIQLSVKIAVDERDKFWANPKHQFNRPKPIVAASVGPYGASLADGSEYRDDYKITEEGLREFHRFR